MARRATFTDEMINGPINEESVATKSADFSCCVLSDNADILNLVSKNLS
jgi:hypothetical protein